MRSNHVLQFIVDKDLNVVQWECSGKLEKSSLLCAGQAHNGCTHYIDFTISLTRDANPLGALLHGRPAARQWRCVTAPRVRSQLTLPDILGLAMWCVYLCMQILYESIQ